MTDVRPDTNSSDWTVRSVALATFYSRLTGLDVETPRRLQADEVEWIELDNGEHPTIAFQRSPTTWRRRGHRSDSQQLHLDFSRSRS